jgi:hypothetical protein
MISRSVSLPWRWSAAVYCCHGDDGDCNGMLLLLCMASLCCCRVVIDRRQCVAAMRCCHADRLQKKNTLEFRERF